MFYINGLIKLVKNFINLFDLMYLLIEQMKQLASSFENI